MFGYVMPNRGELKIKNWNLYQAFYCGVCRSLGKRYGQKARLLLNYDTTFLAILLAGIKARYTLKSGRCLVKMKKQLFAHGESIDLAADINVLLAHFKSVDDWQDEKSIKGLVGQTIYGRSARLASAKHKEIAQAISEMAKGVALVESTNNQSPDVAAIPFKEMMRAMALYVMKGDPQEALVAEFCTILGKWIFIIDSLDDLEEDMKKKQYNPNKTKAEQYSVEQVFDDAHQAMILYMQDLANVFDKLVFQDEQLSAIIENVVYAGLLEKTEKVLKKRSCERCGSK